MVTGCGKRAGRWAPLQWVNTTLANIKTAIASTHHQFSAKHAQRYLTRFPYRFSEGITLELRETAGAVENLRLLQDPSAGVDLAFTQGGIAPVEGGAKVRAIASVFLEPLWLFTRRPAEPESISSLKGLRVAVGAAGSGTREMIKERCVLPDIS